MTEHSSMAVYSWRQQNIFFSFIEESLCAEFFFVTFKSMDTQVIKVGQANSSSFVGPSSTRKYN